MGDVETFGGGFLVEAMVDHRHGVDPAAAPEVDEGVLIVLGRGEADEADGALVPEFAADFAGRRMGVPGARPGAELEEVEAVGAEEGEAVGAEVGEAVGAEVGAVLGEAITLADSPPAGA